MLRVTCEKQGDHGGRTFQFPQRGWKDHVISLSVLGPAHSMPPAQTPVHFLDAPFLFCQYLVRATAKGVEVKGKVAARGKGGEGRWPPAKPGDVGTTVTLFSSSGRVL